MDEAVTWLVPHPGIHTLPPHVPCTPPPHDLARAAPFAPAVTPRHPSDPPRHPRPPISEVPLGTRTLPPIPGLVNSIAFYVLCSTVPPFVSPAKFWDGKRKSLFWEHSFCARRPAEGSLRLASSRSSAFLRACGCCHPNDQMRASSLGVQGTGQSPTAQKDGVTAARICPFPDPRFSPTVGGRLPGCPVVRPLPPRMWDLRQPVIIQATPETREHILKTKAGECRDGRGR